MKKISLVLIILILATAIQAQETDNYRELFEQIQYARIDTGHVGQLDNFVLEHNSLRVTFENGRIAFFEPVAINGDTTFFAAYFKGAGYFYYHPPVTMEQDQLKRFIGRDTINNKFDEMILLFTPTDYEKIKAKTTSTDFRFSDGEIKGAEKLFRFEDDLNQTYHFWLMKSLLNYMPDRFLALSVKPAKLDRLIYCYNPFEREEISLCLRNSNNIKDYMELVNSYSKFNMTEDYNGLNGISKDQIKIHSYRISGDVTGKGIFTCTTTVRFETKIGQLKLLEFSLLPSLKVSSIIDEQGEQIPFERYDLDVAFKDYQSYQVDLFLNKPLSYGDTTELTFIYHGEIAEKEVGMLFVFAGAHWYPRYGYRQLATYEMSFSCPDNVTLIATGQKLSEVERDDKTYSEWRVTTPSANVSFNVGYMKKYLFEDADIVPVEVYFSKDLHNEIAYAMAQELLAVGKDMQEQIAIDVQNSLRVYNYFFGQYPFDRLVVSEVLSETSTSYPASIHYGFNTWLNTDPWGYDRIHRAHEVAHQWWGSGVGYQTYHDQWLSEGFATYSSLIAYQLIEKDKDKFLDKLKDYRNDIFSVRNYLLGSGEESGPIALGYRTSSSKTEGDKNLIIYKKGAFVLHMIRNLLIDFNTMNEDNFRFLMQDFYQLYRGKEATTLDFQRLVEKYTGIEMDWFFRQWVYRNELPTYEFSYSYDTDSTGANLIRGEIITKNVSPDFKMFVPLEIQFEGDKKAYLRLLVDQPVYTFTLPGLAEKPKKLILNPFESVLAKIKQ